MYKVLFSKLKESLISVLPVVLMVVVLHFTPLVNLSDEELSAFLISAVFLVIGIALFNLGADLAMTPMGEQVGAGLSKSKSLKLLLSVCFLMGVLITVAEPDLSVLASQVSQMINSSVLIITVGVGVGFFLVLAILKIVFKRSLSSLLMFFYMLLFALAALTVVNGNSGFLALAFDSGGVTTGPITVPFIMALGVGVAATLGGKNASENSFGLIAMCSVGPVLAVLLLGAFSSGEVEYELPDYSVISASELPATVLETAIDVGIALGLIVLFFTFIQIFFLKLPRRKIIQIVVGIVYTFLGLLVFLSAFDI